MHYQCSSCDFLLGGEVPETLHFYNVMNLILPLTPPTGSMCMCYNQHLCANEDITYTIAFVHRGM